MERPFVRNVWIPPLRECQFQTTEISENGQISNISIWGAFDIRMAFGLAKPDQVAGLLYPGEDWCSTYWDAA